MLLCNEAQKLESVKWPLAYASFRIFKSHLRAPGETLYMPLNASNQSSFTQAITIFHTFFLYRRKLKRLPKVVTQVPYTISVMFIWQYLFECL